MSIFRRPRTASNPAQVELATRLRQRNNANAGPMNRAMGQLESRAVSNQTLGTATETDNQDTNAAEDADEAERIDAVETDKADEELSEADVAQPIKAQNGGNPIEQGKTNMGINGEALEQDGLQDQDEKPAKPAEAEDDCNGTTQLWKVSKTPLTLVAMDGHNI